MFIEIEGILLIMSFSNIRFSTKITKVNCLLNFTVLFCEKIRKNTIEYLLD